MGLSMSQTRAPRVQRATTQGSSTDPVIIEDELTSDSEQEFVVVRAPLPRGQYEERLLLQEAYSPFAGVIRANDDLELDNETFFRVREIFAGEDITLRGILFHFCTRTEGLGNKASEICAVVQAHEWDENPSLDQNLSEIKVDAVVRKRSIVLTNKHFAGSDRRDGVGDFSFRDDLYTSYEDGKTNGVLVCRWKAVRYYRGVPETPHKRMLLPDYARIFLTSSECDLGKDVNDTQKLLVWHGIPQGLSYNTTPASYPARRYRKYAELFAGAGGVSRAAQDAGFEIAALVDHWASACTTLRRNFAFSVVHPMDVHRFLTNSRGLRCAHCHLSPPCQTYSSMKTGPGKNDDPNSAASFAIMETLQRLRPRTVTVENVAGLHHKRNQESFWAFVQQFTDCNYSVRAKIVKAGDYGYPGNHERVIMHGACPGETIPPFKKPTHGTGPELMPPGTIADYLRRLPDYIEPHMRQYTPTNGQPYSAHRIKLRTLLCGTGNGSDLHPCGTRTFTMQERALLKGFEPDHLFARGEGVTTLRKLIGNAIPHCMAFQSMHSAQESLDATDAKIVQHLAGARM